MGFPRASYRNWLISKSKDFYQAGTATIHVSLGKLLLFLCVVGVTLAGKSQDCNVTFPGSSSQNYSTTCISPMISNLILGNTVFMGDNDVFTFDSPSTITIQGDFTVSGGGSGKIVIPTGVTVNVVGNIFLNQKNSKCKSGKACTFDIQVDGTLNGGNNFENHLITVVWSGTGIVAINNLFENAMEGCMECSASTCPAFPAGAGCQDNGVNCGGKDFCVDGNYGGDVPPPVDITPPVISGCPVNASFSITGSNCEETVNWVLPIATDDVGVDSFSSNHNPGDSFPLGATSVTYTATDAAGNATTCSFDVVVEDHIAPVIQLCPPDINVSNFDNTRQMATATWDIPTVSDNCETVSLTGTHNPGDSFPKGKTTVSYTAEDENGNITACDFEVEVTGNRGPVAPSKTIQGQAGQPIEICLEATDPEEDPLILEEVNYFSTNGRIDLNNNTGGLCFTYTSQEDFEGTEIFSVTICDDQDPPASTLVEVEVTVFIDKKLTIYKAFTPDNDNINDQWQIKNIEYYPENKVIVFDRWGGMVYNAEGYNNESVVWDGSSNRRGFSGQGIVPLGTYFYVIDLRDGTPVRKGFIELIK